MTHNKIVKSEKLTSMKVSRSGKKTDNKTVKSKPRQVVDGR